MLKFAVLAAIVLVLFPDSKSGYGHTPEKEFQKVKYDYIPFKAGEKLSYNLHYGMINAGEASLEVDKDQKSISGANHFHILVSGHSYSFFDNFYKVRDKFESYINEDNMLPTIFIRNVQEGSYKKQENYIFVRGKNEVVSGSKNISVPSDIHDIVSTFYFLRCIDFSKQKVGVTFKLNAIFDDNQMETGITYTGKTTLDTKFGKVKCYVFRPLLVKGRVFKNQDDMTLYVSEDKNQIPIRIQSWIYLDYVKADIETYANLKYPFTALVKKK